MSTLFLPRLSRAFGARRLQAEDLDVANGEVNLRDAAVDGELSRRARAVGCLKLRLAELLEVLGREQAHFELGFSSMAAYVRERCERSGRWGAQLRTVARRLEALSYCRAALASGRIHWSQAEVLAQ